MVAAERRLGGEGVDEREAGGGSRGHRDGDGAVQLDDGRRRAPGQDAVQLRDARPVRLLGRPRARVTGRDRALERVRAVGAPERLGPRQRRQPAPDEQRIPARAVLVEQQDRLSRRPRARARARRLDLHQRDEAVHLRLVRSQLGQDPPQTQRVLAQRRPHPVVSRRRRIALVEDEVDHLEHRRQAGGPLRAARDFERDARLGERPLGTNDALGDGGLRDQERAGDLPGGQAAEQAQRQRQARLGGEHRMAGGEDEAQQVVADVVVDGGVEIRAGARLPALELAADLLVLAPEPLTPAQDVDRPALRGGHEPRPRVVGDARLGPPLEGDHQRLLREVLGEADVADEAREAGDEPRRFDTPDRVDGAMGVGSRHGYRSHHRHLVRARRSDAVERH